MEKLKNPIKKRGAVNSIFWMIIALFVFFYGVVPLTEKGITYFKGKKGEEAPTA